MTPIVERKNCPSCGSASIKILARQPFRTKEIMSHLERKYGDKGNVSVLQDFNYEVVRCVKCTLAFQRTVPSDELLKEIYDVWIPQSSRIRKAEKHTLNDYRYWAEQVQFFLLYFKKNPHQVRVFDFGMGWAGWISMARAFGCQVAGSELSKIRQEHARTIGVETIEWDEIPERRFDFINSEQVFEHLIDPLNTLKHLTKSLHRDGLIKISVPDSRIALKKLKQSGGYETIPDKHKMPIQPLEHINCFEHKSLVTLARQAGLRPLHPRMRLLYNSSSGWFSPKQATHQLLRPIYRHRFPKTAFIYFTHETRTLH